MSIIAVIDVGSNSIKVSVTQVDNRQEIARSSESVRLQSEIGPNKPMSKDTINAAVAAIKRLLSFAREHGATKFNILATSAVRESLNHDELSRQILESTGVPLTIISGEVEARLVAAGVRTDKAYFNFNKILVFDLGGGSLEMSVMIGAHCILARSFPLGAVRLTYGYLQGGINRIDELDQLSVRTHIVTLLSTVIPVNAAESFLIIGAGGAFTIVSKYLEEIGETPVDGRLPVLRIRELRDLLCKMDLNQRKLLPYIPNDRADIFPAALITICVLAELTKADAFYLSYRGVRHGMLELLLGPSGEYI